MGIEATLTVIPRSEMKKRQRSANLPEFLLHKSWSELQQALDEIGGVVGKALRGNEPIPDDSADEDDDLDDLDDDDFDSELIDVPPALVKKINTALAKISDERLLGVVAEQRKGSGGRLHKREQGDIIAAFETLKSAYRQAATADAYLRIFIG